MAIKQAGGIVPTLIFYLVIVLILVNGAVAETLSVYTERDLEKYGQKSEQKTETGAQRLTADFRNGEAGTKRITVDFKDTDLQEILKMLAEIGKDLGYDVRIDPAIKGKSTIFAKSMLWADVVDLLLERHNLEYARKGRTIFITRK